MKPMQVTLYAPEGSALECDYGSRFERIRPNRDGRMPVRAHVSSLAASRKTAGSRRASRRVSRLVSGRHHRRHHAFAW